MKKEYSTPELEKFGSVSQLSAGGSSGSQEPGDTGPNADGAIRRP